MVDFVGFINVSSGIFQIAIAILVLLSDAKNKVKRYYSLSALSLGLWSLFIYFYTNVEFLPTETLLKIVYTLAYCMTLTLILFARVFPKEHKKKFKLFLGLNFIYMSVMTYILWSTDYIVVSAQHYPEVGNSLAQMGNMYFFYGLPEFITAIYVVGYYIKEIRLLSGIEKRQVQFYVLGGIIALIPIFVFDFVAPLLFNTTEFYKYGTLGNAIWTIIVGYSILTTRFLGTRVFLGNFIGIFFKGILLLISLSLVVFSLQPIWEITSTYDGFLKLFAVSIPLTILLSRVFRKIDDYIENRVVYAKYSPVKSVNYFVNSISKSLDIEEITNILLNLVEQTMNPQFISIILFDNEGKVKVNSSRGNLSEDYIKEVTNILDAWKKLNSNRILILSEIYNKGKVGKSIIDEKRASIISFMRKSSVEVLFDVREEGKFFGVVMIGQNLNRSSYTVGDIDYLDSLMQNYHLALVRATLHKELQVFNQTLQEKVNEQTEELQIKVKELEIARKKERDMIDIMGHELRTPATIVKLNAELLEKYIHSNPENFKKYLDRIKNSIENEIKLINTLLTSAKLEGSKVEINRERISIPDEIESVIHGYEYEAKAKDLKLIADIDSDTPDVFADKVRTVEIIDNLISNAIKYTDEGSVIVKTERVGDFVQISVIDTGKGIPKEEIHKLGGKFHRIDNYITGEDDITIVRPGGTGLGLYVVFKLIEMMGGSISVESEVNKGSTFTFTLPIYTDQKEDIIDSDSKNMFERFGLNRKN